MDIRRFPLGPDQFAVRIGDFFEFFFGFTFCNTEQRIIDSHPRSDVDLKVQFRRVSKKQFNLIQSN